jgi:hypothetical protein
LIFKAINKIILSRDNVPFNTFSSLWTGIGKGQWVENQERRQQSLKQEEKIIRAQKRRINEKSLILSEFSTGFQATVTSDGSGWIKSYLLIVV